MDGQLIAIFALALSDVNSQAVSVYNAYNPQSATGVALDGAVKTNGLVRRDATKSTVDLKLVGQAGTVITNGVAADASGNRWALPGIVIIPLTGEVTVTAEAEEDGAVSAPAGTVTSIATPTYGWQTVTNPSDAVEGVALETDAELRKRQGVSTMQASSALWDGLLGAVEGLDGVTAVAGEHNDTNSTSDAGIPAHSIAIVAQGGDAQEIAETIYLKKGQGVATYGSVSENVTDAFGNIHQISFSRPTDVTVKAVITVKATETWLSTEQDDIKERLIAYVESLGIGESVNIARCVAAVIKHDDGEYDPDFELTGITLNGSAASISVPWNGTASISSDDITITVS